MSYDRDLRWLRRSGFALCGLNVGIAFAHLHRHEWFLAVVAVSWSLSMILGIWYAQTAQALRDDVRKVKAMMDKLHPTTNEEMQQYLKWLEGGE